MKARLLAFGALTLWMSPALAQSPAADPLAPLPERPLGRLPSAKKAVKPSSKPASVPAASPRAPATAPVSNAQPTATSTPPPTLVASVPKDWRGVFDAIDAGNWASARAGIASLPANLLTPVAKAELYTAKGSPIVDLNSLLALITEAPDLPQAAQLARMAMIRGATTAPSIVPERPIVNLGAAPVRYRARPVQGEALADELRAALDTAVKANDAAGAEAQLASYGLQLSFEARAEAGQRVAWIYYVLGQDLDARRVADTWRPGATGEWASQAAWISGMASWRMGDCNAASGSFQQAASLADQRELKAGAYYWAARAEQACRRPRSVEPLLKAAASSPESFYGLVARETLGMATTIAAESYAAGDPAVDRLPNVQRAVELVRIGELARAEEMLRHQAKIGSPREHHALIQTAKRLELPAAQLWLAKFGQPGAFADAADRYPNPAWQPVNGWRVDPALAYGHIVQESAFRRTAVSGAGAVGLMQVRPGTAGDVARRRGTSLGSLTDPSTNLEYGQSFIEMMRGNSATAGQLPRVIASYNAGPLPVARWATINDKGDPLLWIESIPYWETRYYVPSVLRNMWVYQGLNREDQSTLRAMAEHRWPSFPTSMSNLRH